MTVFFFWLMYRRSNAAVSLSDLIHQWSFDDTNDAVGGASLSLIGSASPANGQLMLPGAGTLRVNYATIDTK